jgi:uncharacterized membrane protein
MRATYPAETMQLRALARTGLMATGTFWFVTAVLGQTLFALAVATFYGSAAWRGDALAWNRFMTGGYLEAHPASNGIVAVHIIAAVVLMLSGALQLTPLARRLAPRLHRWNGRVYLAAAAGASLAGLYMVWVRGTPGDLPQHLGLSLNALLILAFAAMALRRAMQRQIRAHQLWALRLFVVASGVWFFRLGVLLAFALFGHPVGFNPRTFTGPFLTVMTFAQTLLPLAVLELYIWARDHGGARARFAAAGGLFMLTMVMAGGIAVNAAGLWLPEIISPFASRQPVAVPMSIAIAKGGAGAGIAKYIALRNTQPDKFDFGEDQVNGLGYQMIHSRRVSDAAAVFTFGTQVFPHSANLFDSLGEAYADLGDTARAVLSYRKSLALNPANENAADALRELMQGSTP